LLQPTRSSAFILSVLAEPDQGVRRGRGRPPHVKWRLVGVAPVVPEIAQVFPDLLSNPIALFAPGAHFLAPLFAEFPRSLAGFLTRFHSPLSSFATPLPEAIPSASCG
jgi:hypothetical protein